MKIETVLAGGLLNFAGQRSWRIYGIFWRKTM